MDAKTGKDSIWSSTGEEKASIMAPNLWFREGLYKLDGEGNRTTEEGVADCLQEALKLQNRASEAKSHRTHDSPLH